MRSFECESFIVIKCIDIAKRIGAYKFMECSAKLRIGVEEVFETAVKAAISKKKHKNGAACTII